MVWNRQSPIFSKAKIIIGIPHTEMVTMMWATRVLGPLLYLPTHWCEKIPQMARGIPQSVARDQIVDIALKDPEVTHIFWVDSDNVPVKQNKDGVWEPMDPNLALSMLYQVNQPIVSGLYRAKQKEGFNYAAWMDAKIPDRKGFVPVQSYTGNYFKVDVAGMGCCLVKREVYEKVPRPWHPWPEPAPSEDFNFFMAAKKYGYDVNVFADVQLSHIGTLNVMPDGVVRVLEI
jgi:hypothetical protein